MLLRRKHVAWPLLALLAVLSLPSTSQACPLLDCLWPWNWGRQPATAYAPTVGYGAAPACGSCAPTTTYMPVTAYRTVYQPTAVTACQPVTSGCGLFGNCCGLFGSSATTTYRPVTSTVYRPALVPYTTYRAVTAMPVAAPATCNPCGTVPTTTYSLGTSASPSYAPATSYTPSYAPAASACPTNDCGAGVVPQYPATTVPSQTPQTFQENSPQQPSGMQPTQQNGQTGQPPQTYSQPPQTFSQPLQNSALQMKPQSGASNGPQFIQPQLIRPNARPTAQTSVRQATFYRPISAPAAAVPAQKPRLDVGGWHAARN